MRKEGSGDIVGAIIVGAVIIAFGLIFVGYQISSMTTASRRGKRVLNVRVVDVQGNVGVDIVGGVSVNGPIKTY